MAQLQSLTWDSIAISIWERVIAVLFHTAASLLVLKAVREQKSIWWWVAFLLHVLLNGVALIVLQYGGILQSEIALTVFSIISVGVVWWTYQRRETDRAVPIPTQLT